MSKVAKKDNLDREQWILSNQMCSAVSNLNAAFCEDGPAQDKDANVWIDTVAGAIAEKCSVMMLEDAISVLEKAMNVARYKNLSPYAEGVLGRDLDKRLCDNPYKGAPSIGSEWIRGWKARNYEIKSQKQRSKC